MSNLLQDLRVRALEAARRDDLVFAEGIWRDLFATYPATEAGLEAARNLAISYLKRGAAEEAARHLVEARAVFPEDPVLALWQGHAACKQGDLDAGARSYELAAALAPGDPAPLLLAAMAHRDLGRTQDALPAIEAFIGLCPNEPHGHFEYAQLLLAKGSYRKGFAEYEWRLKRPLSPARVFPFPPWDGTLRSGLRLLVTAEQGHGDTIHFARFLPLLAARGLRVTFACHPSLVRLFQDFVFLERVVEVEKEPLDCDAHVPVMSLPHFLKLEGATLFGSGPYLLAHPEKGPKLPDAGTPSKKKVGLVWAGNPAQQNDSNRSMPFSCLAPLLQKSGIRFFSLQKEGAPSVFPDGLVDLGPSIRDYADCAALIAQLDLVVSVDTSVLHLAGALGRPCWGMLCYAPCWRWRAGETTSPWYPSLRAFRQKKPGDWAGVIEKVGRALDEL